MNECEFIDECCVYGKHKNSFSWRWMIADFCKGSKGDECIVRHHYEQLVDPVVNRVSKML